MSRRAGTSPEMVRRLQWARAVRQAEADIAGEDDAAETFARNFRVGVATIVLGLAVVSSAWALFG